MLTYSLTHLNKNAHTYADINMDTRQRRTGRGKIVGFGHLYCRGASSQLDTIY